jgi:hypothetical protein
VNVEWLSADPPSRIETTEPIRPPVRKPTGPYINLHPRETPFTTYTIVSTFPREGSTNVGDKLIEHAVERIVEAERGSTEFSTVFRENPLDDHLDRINDSDAVLLPAFAIRDLPLYPETYRFTENLSDITMPMIPIGANYNVYPGDEGTREELDFSPETVEVLERIAQQVESFSCREQYTCDVLEGHSIDNTLLTGDPAWFDPDWIGDSMRRPGTVEQVVFTPPLSPYYVEQAIALIEMLADLFPDHDGSSRSISTTQRRQTTTRPPKECGALGGGRRKEPADSREGDRVRVRAGRRRW